MAEYDFHQLSSHDFEILGRDLLQAHWKVEFRSFKSGKDGGVDLLYQDDEQKIIVQCKHYVRTGYRGLLRALKDEVENVKQLAPTRYVVMTSMPLSKANIDEIVRLFDGLPLSANDVFGQEYLNCLLAEHPTVQQKHYKLWLGSRAVLDRVLHSAILNRSQFAVQKVHASICRYVQTDAFPRAFELLKKHRVVILTGPPGVGKTTLANMLMYAHLEEGYEPIIVNDEMRDAESMCQEGVKRIFYYDDFLGATYLDERGTLLANNGDRAIVNLIAMVGASKSAKLILTTRDHILTQALSKSERLRHADMGAHKLVLSISDYSFEQKAKILYNHLYFSELPVAYQRELVADDLYLKIIRHRKFNPRLIEWLSTYHRVSKVAVEDYRQFVQELLDDPTEIWRHAYESQLSHAGRSLFLSLCSHGGRAKTQQLRSTFMSLHACRAQRYHFQHGPDDLRLALTELNGAFMKPGDDDSLTVLDPSVLDLFNTVVRESPANAIDIIASAQRFEPIYRMWSLSRGRVGQIMREEMLACHDSVARSVQNTILLSPQEELALTPNALVSYTGLEVRLVILIEMADELTSPLLVHLIPALTEKLVAAIDDGDEDEVDLAIGAEVLRAFASAGRAEVRGLQFLRTKIRDALVRAAADSDNASELQTLVEALDLNGADADVRQNLATAFENYQRLSFYGDLYQCSNSADFHSLMIDLDVLSSTLNVPCRERQEAIRSALEDFERAQEEKADEDMERWRDAQAREIHGEESVREMFASLLADR